MKPLRKHRRKTQHKNAWSIGLHALYMLFLFPVFLFITVIMGLNNFSDNYRIIEENYGLKLEAVSIVAGAFLDGTPYLESEVDRFDVSALAALPGAKRLVGFDRHRDRLLDIDPLHGAATVIDPSVGVELTGLAYDTNRSKLYGIDSDGGLYHVLMEAGRPAERIRSISAPVTGIAYQPDQDRLWLWSNGLIGIDMKSGEMHRRSEDDSFDVIALAYVSPQKQLVALSCDPYRLHRVDSENGRLSAGTDLSCRLPVASDYVPLPDQRVWQALQYDRILQSGDRDTIRQTQQAAYRIARGIDYARMLMAHESGEDDPDFMPKIGRLRGLAVHPEKGILLASSSSLSQIDWASNTVQPYGLWPGYVGELDPEILSLLSPLRRIWKKLDLTYLYTFYRKPGAGLLDIVYSLDANIDGEHSFAGDNDVFPKDSLYDMYGRIYLGQLYLSDIVEWEEWGLIKTGYAPIYRRDGTIFQVVGADVNVSIIESRTRIHLLQTAILVLILFFLAMAATFYVTRAMIQPIAELNETALIVAAGEYGKKTRVSGSTEFRALCEAFNQYSLTLKEAEDKRKYDNRILNYQTSYAELIRHLEYIRNQWPHDLQNRWQVVHFSQDTSLAPISQAMVCPGGWLAWSGYSENDPLKALRMQMDIASIARHLFRGQADEWSKAVSCLQPMNRERIDGFFYLDRSKSCLYALCRIDLRIVHLSAAGVSIQTPDEVEGIPLASGDIVLIASERVAESIPALWKEEDNGSQDENRLSSLLQRIESVYSKEELSRMAPNYVMAFHWVV